MRDGVSEDGSGKYDMDMGRLGQEALPGWDQRSRRL